MTDQYINEKRAELKNLRAQYRGVVGNLKLLRNVFKNKKINEMIDAGLIHVLCDHKNVTTEHHERRFEKDVIRCVNCYEELFNMAGILLNKQEFDICYKIEYKNQDIFGGYGATLRADIQVYTNNLNILERKYREIKEEIGAHVLEGLRKVGFISKCKHPGVEQNDKKCTKCNQYVWIKHFGWWLNNEDYNTVQNTLHTIPEFDVVSRTEDINAILKEDRE